VPAAAESGAKTCRSWYGKVRNVDPPSNLPLHPDHQAYIAIPPTYPRPGGICLSAAFKALAAPFPRDNLVDPVMPMIDGFDLVDLSPEEGVCLEKDQPGHSR
jgi:hypothetical protein